MKGHASPSTCFGFVFPEIMHPQPDSNFSLSPKLPSCISEADTSACPPAKRKLDGALEDFDSLADYLENSSSTQDLLQTLESCNLESSLQNLSPDAIDFSYPPLMTDLPGVSTVQTHSVLEGPAETFLNAADIPDAESPATSTSSDGTVMESRTKRKRRLSRQAKVHKNSYERTRLHTITSALDCVQSKVWKERVSRKEDRRKRANVLRRATEYIRLLQDAVNGSVSEELATCLRYFVAKSPEDSAAGGSRTLMLQLLLQGHEKEISMKTLSPELSHLLA